MYTIKKRVLILTGPNYKRCIEELENHNLIGKKMCEITVVERDNEVFRQIYEQALDCPYYQKHLVKLHNCDLKDIKCYNYNFQDIDLMCTWKNGYELLKDRLIQQLNRDKAKCLRSPKYFMFTLSEWGIPLQESYNYLKEFLKETLNCKLWGINRNEGEFGKGIPVSAQASNWRYIKQYIPACYKGDWGDRIRKIHLYRYRDTTNMMTCLIEHD